MVSLDHLIAFHRIFGLPYHGYNSRRASLFNRLIIFVPPVAYISWLPISSSNGVSLFATLFTSSLLRTITAAYLMFSSLMTLMTILFYTVCGYKFNRVSQIHHNLIKTFDEDGDIKRAVKRRFIGILCVQASQSIFLSAAGLFIHTNPTLTYVVTVAFVALMLPTIRMSTIHHVLFTSWTISRAFGKVSKGLDSLLIISAEMQAQTGRPITRPPMMKMELDELRWQLAMLHESIEVIRDTLSPPILILTAQMVVQMAIGLYPLMVLAAQANQSSIRNIIVPSYLLFESTILLCVLCGAGSRIPETREKLFNRVSKLHAWGLTELVSLPSSLKFDFLVINHCLIMNRPQCACDCGWCQLNFMGSIFST